MLACLFYSPTLPPLLGDDGHRAHGKRRPQTVPTLPQSWVCHASLSADLLFTGILWIYCVFNNSIIVQEKHFRHQMNTCYLSSVSKLPQEWIIYPRSRSSIETWLLETSSSPLKGIARLHLNDYCFAINQRYTFHFVDCRLWNVKGFAGWWLLQVKWRTDTYQMDCSWGMLITL